MTPRIVYNVLYRVLDATGHTLEVVQQSGKNKNYIQWLVERRMKKKHGKNISIHQIKITQEA
jgi:hypothetical protein